MSEDRAGLDATVADALALSRSALALAEWARDLIAPVDQQAQVLIAESVAVLASHVTATATALIDRCRPQGEYHR
jgi:hypothetical protein